MGIYFHGCCQTAAFIHINCHQALFALTHFMTLLLKWKQQILLQTKIQKSAYFSYFLYLQYANLANLELRHLSSRDQTILRILVNKYLYTVTNLGSCRHLLFRQKHRCLIALLLCQINTKVLLTDYYKSLFLS